MRFSAVFYALLIFYSPSDQLHGWSALCFKRIFSCGGPNMSDVKKLVSARRL